MLLVVVVVVAVVLLVAELLLRGGALLEFTAGGFEGGKQPRARWGGVTLQKSILVELETLSNT